jgi:hypothetical protein
MFRRRARKRGAPVQNLLEEPMKTTIATLAVLAAFAIAPAYADTVKYKANLNGASEVPANDTKGTGTIEATYDSATKTLSWSGEYSGLTGPEAAAHFHGPAALGTNAGVLVPVDAKASPFKGMATLTDEQAKAFADGKVYFNIHTAANKGGEIRGQLAPAM